MNPLPLVLTWAAGGSLAALLMPRLRRRRLAAVVPLAAAVTALAGLGSGADLAVVAAPGGLALGRPGSGLALVSALATAMALVLSPPLDPGDIFLVGACGALSVVAMATGTPVVWGACLLGGLALMGIRWLAASPSRATLAGARVATLGGAALVAASPFLPVDATAPDPRMRLTGGLLAIGVAATIGLLPVGGWVVGGARHLRAPALVPWALLLLPAAVLTGESVEPLLPGGSGALFAGVILVLGAGTAGWSALYALLIPDEERYVRVLLADLGLVAFGLATHDNGTRFGGLLLVLTHLITAPLMLQAASLPLARPRRLAWLTLSGIPPSPAFWGRFSLIVGIAASYGGSTLVVTVPVLGALVVVSLRAVAAARLAGDDADLPGPSPAVRVAAWMTPLAALAIGLLPDPTLRVLLGVG